MDGIMSAPLCSKLADTHAVDRMQRKLLTLDKTCGLGLE